MTPEAEFIQRSVAAAADLALLFVGEPEEKMLAALSQTRQNLARELSEAFGVEAAASFADAFVAAVAGHRREIEPAGSLQARN
jgi:hypothetical protein